MFLMSCDHTSGKPVIACAPATPATAAAPFSIVRRERSTLESAVVSSGLAADAGFGVSMLAPFVEMIEMRPDLALEPPNGSQRCHSAMRQSLATGTSKR